jgi:conjugative transposon TraJ protein
MKTGKIYKIGILTATSLAIPQLLLAQGGNSGMAGDIQSLHTVLKNLYDTMLPLCSRLIGVGRGIAGFAALWYIASRVWGHLSRAESIDFFPLFRPFVIGFAILIFPSVIALINGVMQPTVDGTAHMVENSDAAVAALLAKKADAEKHTDTYLMYVGPSGQGDRDRWYKYTHPGEDPAGEGMFEGIGNDVRFAMAKAAYNFRSSIKEWMSEVLQVLFVAASLCINTIRTFNLIILAILGPLVFGLSVFDGFHHTLRYWLSRYINVFLWLPIANIFGAVISKIQENMLRIDISQIQNSGDTFFNTTDMGYLIFMIIGIVGYFTVPSIAGHVMHVGGGDAITGKATALAGAAAGAVMTGGQMVSGVKNMTGAAGNIRTGYNQPSTGKGMAASAGRAWGSASHHLKNSLKGGASEDSTS